MATNYTASDAKNDLKDNANQTANKTASDLREGANEAKRTAQDAIDSAKEKGQEALDTARERGAEYAERARHEADRLYREGQRKVGEVAHYAEDYYDEMSDMVRRKPAQALGIAAGVGFLVGLILARR
ncbi:DUF883 family protein [Paracoccus sp. Z118]|uniref:DUF883 family protein n=1 Tax=Paracoccus sp. Z118 TaxID=2851017 RepID=UPI001C2C91E0|nr:DUF883 family protein [Paracoccus sp. Z118]MBV0892425.1 DUF883 family protein [Paracoccus sp. Z118]